MKDAGLYIVLFQPLTKLKREGPILAWRDTYRTFEAADSQSREIQKSANAFCWIMHVEDPRMDL